MGKKLIVINVLLLLLSGCWDRTEIEELGFVISAAVNSVDEESEEFERGTDKLATTYQIAIPGRMAGGAEETESSEKPFFTIKTTEKTNFSSNRNIPSRRSRRLTFEHLKVLLLDDDLVQQDMLKYTLDFYIRDHAMRRNTEIFVVEGEADEVLYDDRPPDPLTGLALQRIVENDSSNLSMIEKSTISDITNSLLSKSSFVVPRIIERQDTSYWIRGGAIFNGDGEYGGWLTDEMAVGYNILVGDMKNGIVQTSLDNPEEMFVFETGRMRASVDVQAGKENTPVVYNVSLKAEGALVESWIEREDSVTQESFREMEGAIEKYMVSQAEAFIEKVQGELFLDFIGFSEKLRIQEFDLWRQLKDEWEGPEGHFKDVEINISADARIRHFMTKERAF
ncbi:Ger(x)C family spore germination protein [Alteribacter keqinensis]|uniref:Ger(X)C family spore germination protein n=1 Tax=Alteribacter keqinensis TaxID=2483800 RepID=A0A3M7TVE8_9BACI|nr:Ger(x)C family spore germination protein [Alteribacter keqinensis]RNA68724.1 Ger(x)C family spore germination protein [Alteribacter keqinensis]